MLERRLWALVCPVAIALFTTAPAVDLRDTHEQLNPVLWMQTSGEYWALSASAYARAAAQLSAGLKDKSRTAATEQAGAYKKLPPAVILDLDETVLDNSPYQGYLVRNRSTYDTGTWNAWVMQHRATAIPGVVEFLEFAAKSHVTPFFVSNRTADQKAVTIRNLQDLGIAATADTVLLNGENGWTSDKTSRRAFVARSHRILLLVGDDLGDFVTVTDPALDARRDAARKYASWWGDRWILLPNAMYGGWERSLSASGLSDAETLAARKARLRAFDPAGSYPAPIH